MRVLAVLEGNLVVVEPRLETVLRHANVDFCVTGCKSTLLNKRSELALSTRDLSGPRSIICTLAPLGCK